MLRSDLDLERDVAAELACDAACRHAKVGISVKNGVVTLSGTVSDAAYEVAVVRAVKRVYGVDGIARRVVVVPAPVDAEPAQAPAAG